MESNKKQLCIILGAIPRCGSNYLFNSLMLHPDIKRVAINEEDKILVSTNLIKTYAAQTSSSWFKEENLKDQLQQKRLEQSIGLGLKHFFQNESNESGKLLLSKTPLTQGIGNFFELFPNSKLIILVRSGRDAVESGRKSFGWPYDDAIIRYKNSLERIKKFVAANQHKTEQFRLVRYEDLLANEENEISNLLSFLNIDNDIYDFDKLNKQAVKGSSTTKKDADKPMDWKGFTDKTNFDPTKRSANWPKSIERMYYRECNDLLAYFGYPIQEFDDNRFLKIKDFFSMQLKNISGILKRASSYSFSRILKTIKYRIKTAFRILVFGYYSK